MEAPPKARFWVGVASKDHVRRGVAKGFCQLGHGKAHPVQRLSPGDWIVYYSPREELSAGGSVQAFTAIGRIRPGPAYQGEMGGGFRPWRRDVAWRKRARAAPIQPLRSRLSFTKGREYWGIVFRRSSFRVTHQDFARIARAMGVVVRTSAA